MHESNGIDIIIALVLSEISMDLMLELKVGSLYLRKKLHYGIYGVNPLPDMPLLGFSQSAAIKDMMSKIWTDGGYNYLIE